MKIEPESLIQAVCRYNCETLDAYKIIIAYIRNDGTTALIGNTERPMTRVILQTALNEIDEKYKVEREAK